MSSLSEAERTKFYTEFMAATSAESAEILMSRFFDADFGRFATKADLEPLATRVDLAVVDAKVTVLDRRLTAVEDRLAGVEGAIADLHVEMQKSFSAQTWKMVTAMIAFAGVLTAGMHFA